MWFRWVTHFGLSGPDRAQGGRYLFVGPGDDGPLPDGGFSVSHRERPESPLLGRAFLIDNDPTPALEAIRAGFRISPYVPGATGPPSRRSWQAVPLAQRRRPARHSSSKARACPFARSRRTTSRTGTLASDRIQANPPSLAIPRLLGHLAAIGIVKGKPSSPMRGCAASSKRPSLSAMPRLGPFGWHARPEEGFAYDEDSHW